MTEPVGPLQYLQSGYSWFNRQSDNTRVVLIAAVSLIGPITLIALYSFISDNLATILILLAGMGLLSVGAGVGCYLYFKRKNEAEDQRRIDENAVPCPSCTQWNDKDEEFCRNCARPFKDQQILEDFLKGLESRPATERDLWRPDAPGRAQDPVPVPMPAASPPRPRKGVLVSHRSFTWAALVTMLLYLFLCWPIGAVANLMWLSEADGIYRRTGTSPSGRGCLRLLGWVFILVPVILIVLAVIVILSQGHRLPVGTPKG